MSSVRSMMVTVGANVAPYVAGMRTAQTATGQFATSTAAARGGAGKLSGALGGLSPKLLGPAGLVFGLKSAVGQAKAFDESTIRLRTQIGLSTTAADNMATSAREIGVEFGVGGQAAIDASWQIASAGLRGETATLALEAAARASAVGFGEMETLAGLSAAAVNAYGEEVLDASEATDIVAAAVREGTAAPQEMADTLGRLLPLASEMGIRFDEIAAAQAAMTRTGSDASEASTQLRGILSSILNPAESSAEAMGEFGLSAEGLRQIIEEDGLFAALMSIRDAVGENDEAFGRIFPNIRALTGFLDLTGANAEATSDVFDQLADATGTVDDSFRDLEESSTQFQWDRFKSNIKDAALETAGLNDITREYLRSVNEVFDRGVIRSTFVDPLTFRDTREQLDDSGIDLSQWFTGDAGLWDQGPNQNVPAHLEAMRAQADQYVDSLEAAAGAADAAAGPQSYFADAVELVAEASERAEETLTSYLDEVRAATDPMFALREAVSDVDAAQQLYNDVVAEHGENSDEARAASWELFEALTELERAALNGELSFADFERELQRMVDTGQITEQQANDIREGVDDLSESAREFDGEYTATLVAEDRASEVVDRLISKLGRVQGTHAARLTLQADAYTSGEHPSQQTSPTTGGTQRRRAAGGSFYPGMSALVGEDGPELVTFAGSGRVIPANQTAHLMGAVGSADRTLNVQQTFHGTDRTVLAEARHQQRLAFLEAV